MLGPGAWEQEAHHAHFAHSHASLMWAAHHPSALVTRDKVSDRPSCFICPPIRVRVGPILRRPSPFIRWLREMRATSYQRQCRSCSSCLSERAFPIVHLLFLSGSPQLTVAPGKRLVSHACAREYLPAPFYVRRRSMAGAAIL